MKKIKRSNLKTKEQKKISRAIGGLLYHLAEIDKKSGIKPLFNISKKFYSSPKWKRRVWNNFLSEVSLYTLTNIYDFSEPWESSIYAGINIDTIAKNYSYYKNAQCNILKIYYHLADYDFILSPIKINKK